MVQYLPLSMRVSTEIEGELINQWVQSISWVEEITPSSAAALQRHTGEDMELFYFNKVTRRLKRKWRMLKDSDMLTQFEHRMTCT